MLKEGGKPHREGHLTFPAKAALRTSSGMIANSRGAPCASQCQGLAHGVERRQYHSEAITPRHQMTHHHGGLARTKSIHCDRWPRLPQTYNAKTTHDPDETLMASNRATTTTSTSRPPKCVTDDQYEFQRFIRCKI